VAQTANAAKGRSRMDEVLLREREDRIEIWTLNRPD
jgi:hypothetical protein